MENCIRFSDDEMPNIPEIVLPLNHTSQTWHFLCPWLTVIASSMFSYPPYLQLSPPFVLLTIIRLQNIKQKIPEIKVLWVLKCLPFWVEWWILAISYSLPRAEVISLPRVSISLSNQTLITSKLSHSLEWLSQYWRTACWVCITLNYLIMAPTLKNSDAVNSDIPMKS